MYVSLQGLCVAPTVTYRPKGLCIARRIYVRNVVLVAVLALAAGAAKVQGIGVHYSIGLVAVVFKPMGWCTRAEGLAWQML